MFGGIKRQYCYKCEREITANNFRKHSESCKGPKVKKIRGEDFDPNVGYKDGSRKAWNKGMRSKPDTRNPEYIGKIGGYRPNAGISKKHRVLDSFGNEVVLQSSYELACSEILNDKRIRWIRPKALKYSGRNYFADFFLVDFNIYLDPKNSYKAKLDRQKIEKVIEENSVQVYILTEDMINEEYITTLVSPNGEGLS